MLGHAFFKLWQWFTRPPDDRKDTQTAVVWSCFPFIRSGKNHLARHSERGEKTRQAEEEVGRQHQGMDRPGVRHVPEGSGEQGKMEKTGCKIICGAPTTLTVKGLMMMMVNDLHLFFVYFLKFNFHTLTPENNTKNENKEQFYNRQCSCFRDD